MLEFYHILPGQRNSGGGPVTLRETGHIFDSFTTEITMIFKGAGMINLIWNGMLCNLVASVISRAWLYSYDV